MSPWDQFSGANTGYVFELYERFQRDPASVDEATRAIFQQWNPADPAAGPGVGRAGTLPAPDAHGDADLGAAVAAFSLAQSLRRFGHLDAQVDPLGLSNTTGDPALSLDTYGLTPDVLRRLPASVPGGPAADGAAHALEVIERLRRIYCGTSGYDFNHVWWPRSAAGCGRPSNRGSSGRRGTPSTTTSCSTVSLRSRCSSASCTAPSPARRASRSRGST
jgi:2-oxoglutarate dehydrogenase E1 component